MLKPASQPAQPVSEPSARELKRIAEHEEQAANTAWNDGNYHAAAAHFERAAQVLRQNAAVARSAIIETLLKRKAAKLQDLCNQLRELIASGPIDEAKFRKLRAECQGELQHMNSELDVTQVQLGPVPSLAPLAPIAGKEASRQTSHGDTTDEGDRPSETTAQASSALRRTDPGSPPLKPARLHEIVSALARCDFEYMAKCFEEMSRDFSVASSNDTRVEIGYTMSSVFAREIANSLRKPSPEAGQGPLELARNAYSQGNHKDTAEHLKRAALQLIASTAEAKSDEEASANEMRASKLLIFSSRIRKEPRESAGA